MKKTDHRLPPELAFVVQLNPHEGPHDAGLSGRVEHIASGKAERFTTLNELHAFMGNCAQQTRHAQSRGRETG